MEKPYWIKKRYNPQLGVYFVAMGQMSKTKAKQHESAKYGSNAMLRYETEEEYESAITALKSSGEKVHQ